MLLRLYKLTTSPLASLVILVLGAQFFQTYLTIALTDAGYTEFYVGLVHSASYAGLLVSALYSEKLIHRIGHIRSFSTFSSIITATILLQAFYMNITLWVIARFCSGLALAALYVTIESWLLADSTVANRAKNLAIYMITLYFSQAVSSQLLNLVDVATLQPYLLAAIFCAASSIPVSMTHHASPILPVRQPMEIGKIYRLSPYAFIGCFVSGLTASSLYSFLPRYALAADISVSWSMSTLIAGGFILQWPLGKLSDIFRRERVIVVTCLACIIPATALIVFKTPNLVYTMLFAIGGINFAIYPISIALACDSLKDGCIVQTTGVLLFSYGLGSVTGPIVVASGIDILNAEWVLFAFVGIAFFTHGIFGIAKAFTIPRLGKGRKDEDSSVEYVMMPPQSPIANELDPRQEVEEQYEYVGSMPTAANDPADSDDNNSPDAAKVD